MSSQSNAEAIVRAYDAMWNSHDVARILDSFTDDAEVRLVPPPPPPIPAVCKGKEQIRAFVEAFSPGFQVESRDFAIQGDRVTWKAAAASDRFREMGLDVADGTGELVLEGDRAQAFTFTLSPETLARLEANMAARAQG